MKKTYVIHVSEYPFRGDPAKMYAFHGEFRELLLRLQGGSHPLLDDELVSEDAEEGDVEFGRRWKDFTDEQLKRFVQDADEDDGGHYHDVWCVEDGKQVM